MWVSAIKTRGEPRLTLSACPVSSITGESVSFVEDFFAHTMCGAAGDLQRWPARRVEAFAVLYGELRKWEREENAQP